MNEKTSEPKTRGEEGGGGRREEGRQTRKYRGHSGVTVIITCTRFIDHTERGEEEEVSMGIGRREGGWSLTFPCSLFFSHRRETTVK